MSIVAPISATGVTIPVLVGLASGERPGALQVVGMVLACCGVVLAAREAPATDAEARRTGRTAIGLALLAAIGFGSFFAGIDRAEQTADVAWVLLAARAADVALLVAAAALVRPRIPTAPRALGAIAAVGFFDLLANFLFVIAAGRGLLSVVGVLGSLYPGGHGRARPDRAARAAVAHPGRGRADTRSPASSRWPPANLGTATVRPGRVRTSDSPRPPAALPLRRRPPVKRPKQGAIRVTTARPRAARAALPQRCSPLPRQASSKQVMTFEAPGELLDDSQREATLDEIQAFGVKRVRALVYWREFFARARTRAAAVLRSRRPHRLPAWPRGAGSTGWSTRPSAAGSSCRSR